MAAPSPLLRTVPITPTDFTFITAVHDLMGVIRDFMLSNSDIQRELL